MDQGPYLFRTMPQGFSPVIEVASCFVVYRAQEGLVNLDEARHCQIGAQQPERRRPSSCRKGEEEGRFGKVTASTNSPNLTERGIVEGKILFLKRASHKPEGGGWGLPGGKLERSESARQAVQRELLEETKIHLKEDHLVDFGKLYGRKAYGDFVFHMFLQEVLKRPKVGLNAEHDAFKWVSPKEAFELPLMDGGREVVRYFLEERIKECE